MTFGSPRLVALWCVLVVSSVGCNCGTPNGPDGGVPEPTVDAGQVEPDAGNGARDAGALDAGSADDAGVVDAGAPSDAGTSCAGSTVLGQSCAGANACEVSEYRCVDDLVVCVGTGTARGATTVCRPASGTCDVAETCDGAALACPADAFASATTICRAAQGTCDVAETCSGAAAECPADGVAPVATECRASAGACDVAEHCDGAAVACPADGVAPATTVCRASAGACDVAESCDGTAVDCPSDVLAAAATECRASTGACDVAEVCSGTAAACPADAFAPVTTTCRASAGACDVAETCTGSSGLCPADTFAPVTTTCRASAGACDVAEACTGVSADCPNDTFAPVTTTCRASAGACDVAEACTGVSADCPNDAFASATTTCRASTGTCDVAEVCTGNNAACPVDAFASATTTCRPSAGACDVAEACTGTSTACPADTFASATTTCRPSAGACDVAEACSGSSAACPADTFATATTTCRPSAGACDVAESCTGSAVACPADGFLSGTTICRASTGVCDPQESCTGSSAVCPVNVLSPSTTVCRASAGLCDTAETCTGTGGACPADVLLPSSTVCRASAGVCDPAESCTGTSAACPGDALATSTTVCRASTGVCDPQETCNGSSAACPANVLSPSTTVCRASAGVCDTAETCTGTGGACPADGLVVAGTVCRASAGVCDPAESCTGSSAACPADALLPSSTVCRASTGVCDPQETCSGSAAACPANAFSPSTTICRASAGACDVAESCTGSAGACPADLLASTMTQCRADADGAGCDTAEFCSGSSVACPINGNLPAGSACMSGSQNGTCTAGGTCTVPFGPDLTFSGDGDAEGVTPSPGTSFADDNSQAAALITAGTHAGKVIVVGSVSGSVAVATVLRVLPNGTLDTTFGTNGLLMLPNAGLSGTYDRFRAVAVTSTGKIVIGGETFANVNADDALVVRLNDDGSYDTSFGTNGRVVINNIGGGSNLDRVAALALQADGKVVIAGISRAAAPATNNKLYVGRLNANGTIDTTFGGPTGDNASDLQGFVTDTLAGGAASSPADQIACLAIDSSSRIYGAGFTRDATNNNIPAVWRFTTTGRRDATWDGDGRFVTTFLGGDYTGCTIDGSNRLIAAGRPNSTSSLVSRWTLSTGALDGTFGSGGHVTPNFGSPQSTAIQSIAAMSDGRLVGLAYWGNASSNNDLVTFRLTAAGALDTSFSGDGYDVRDNLAGGNRHEAPTTAVLLSDNTVIAVGNSEVVNVVATSFSDDTVLLKYTTAGALDTTYGGGDGILLHGTTGFRQDIASDVAIRADGTIVAAGWTNVVGAGTSNENGALWAYTSTGAPATSFNGTGLQFYDNTRRDQFFGVATDGNLTLACGYSDRAAGGNDLAVVRYTAAGALDTSFCGTGSCLFAPPSFAAGASATGSAQAHDVLVRPSGGYLAVGTTATASSGNDALAVALTAAGALDTTFGAGGVFLHNGAANGNTVANSAERLYAAARQSDGKYVLVGAGASGSALARGDDLIVFRLTAAGALDPTFDGDGIATYSQASAAGTRNDTGRAVAIQSNGAIVIAGSSTDANGNQHITVWRLTSTGALDTTFDADGYFVDAAALSLVPLNEARLGLAIDSAGLIYVSSVRFNAGTGFDLAILRLTSAGVLDTTFDGDGVFTQHNAGGGNGRDYAHGLVIDSSGRLVVSGQSRGPGTNDQDGIVWRFQ